MSAMPPSKHQPWALFVGQIFKGNACFGYARELGYIPVMLTTSALLRAPWDHDELADVFAVPSLADRQTVRNVVAFLSRTRPIRRIGTVDDAGVDLAAHLREYLNVPGMNESEARRFRDKLTMRTVAQTAGVRVPAFTSLVYDGDVHDFLTSVPGPWLIKPRSDSSSKGITRIEKPHEAWTTIASLGDDRPRYLMEQYVPGKVYHVDSVMRDGRILFAEAHAYRKPLLEIVEHGGAMVTTTVAHGSALETQLLEFNQRVLTALGLRRGVSHTEIIVGRDDGELYFLESAARVGGAHIPELVSATTGVNLWREYTRLELDDASTEFPTRRALHGALMVGISKQKSPDFSAFQAPEVATTLSHEPYQAGIVLTDPDAARLASLVEAYEPRFQKSFL